MSNTRFANASGLPDNRHRTTARDIALLSQALWRDFPTYYHYFQTPSFAWRRGSARSHNRLIGQVEGVDGIKTGYTRASGFNLATMAERNGQRVIVVVLGGETAAARDAQVAYLIEGAYEEYARRRRSERVTYANLPNQPARRGPCAWRAEPGVARAATAGSSLPYQGMVVETLAPVRAALERHCRSAKATKAEATTEEPE